MKKTTRSSVESPVSPVVTLSMIKNRGRKKELCTYKERIRIADKLTKAFGGGYMDYHSLVDCKEDKNDGFVYFIQCVATENIKIGKTTKSVNKRASQFKGMCPAGIRILKVIPNTNGTLEYDIQQYFDSLRIDGKKEWFLCAKRLMDFINGLDGIDPDVEPQKQITAPVVPESVTTTISPNAVVPDRISSIPSNVIALVNRNPPKSNQRAIPETELTEDKQMILRLVRSQREILDIIEARALGGANVNP